MQLRKVTVPVEGYLTVVADQNVRDLTEAVAIAVLEAQTLASSRGSGRIRLSLTWNGNYSALKTIEVSDESRDNKAG